MIKKISTALIILFLVILLSNANAYQCRKSTACSGSCWIGNCVPIPTSLPALGGKRVRIGWYAGSTKCGICWKGSIPVGTCGPKLASRACPD